MHLAGDVRFHRDNLDSLGAWPFENFLQTEKRQVRSGKNPLSQIVKRTLEREESQYEPLTRRIPGLSSKSPNNFYLLESGDACEISAFDGGIPLCRIFNLEPVFDRPCSSSVIGIHRAGRVIRENVRVAVNQFVTRCIEFKYNGHQYILCLHHKMDFV